VEAYEKGAGLIPRCLVVIGSTRVGGSMADGAEQPEVRVWGLEELDLQQTLWHPAGADFCALLAIDGEVCVCGGEADVVVWGRRA
jgi:hypothetical protein